MDPKSKTLQKFVSGEIDSEEAVCELKKKKLFRGPELTLLTGLSTLGKNDYLGAIMRVRLYK